MMVMTMMVVVVVVVVVREVVEVSSITLPFSIQIMIPWSSNRFPVFYCSNTHKFLRLSKSSMFFTSHPSRQAMATTTLFHRPPPIFLRLATHRLVVFSLYHIIPWPDISLFFLFWVTGDQVTPHVSISIHCVIIQKDYKAESLNLGPNYGFLWNPF